MTLVSNRHRRWIGRRRDCGKARGFLHDEGLLDWRPLERLPSASVGSTHWQLANIMRWGDRAGGPTLRRICGCGRAVGDWCYAVVVEAVRSTGMEVAAERFADDVRRGGVLRGSAFVHCSSQLGIESDG